MAYKRQKLESDVLRLRNQPGWEKMKEGVKLLITKHGASDPLLKLVETEVELELYLLDHEPCSDNTHEARIALAPIKKKLHELQSSDTKTSLFQVAEEATLLLAKVNFVEGNLTSCLEIYSNLSLLQTQLDVFMYKKKMFSEAFAIKGFCLENEFANVKDEKKMNKITECFEHSINYLLLYLQELEKASPPSNTLFDENVVGLFSQKAIHQCCVIDTNNSDVWKAVKLLRHVMKCAHASLPLHAQQDISHKLAVILLRGTSPGDYRKEKSVENVANELTYLRKSKKSEPVAANEDSSLAANNSKAKFFFGEKKYIPSCLEQEVLLLLLISEIMMNVDPVLDMSPEHAESREETLVGAESLYDLLTIVCSHLGQYDLLTSTIEKSLKYSFDRIHIWQQYALSLALAGKNSQALPCLSECCNIKPGDPTAALVAAKLCYEELPPNYNEGLEYAQMAVKMSAECFDKNDGMRSRAYLSVGVGKSIKGAMSRCRRDRITARLSAISSYKRANSADPSDCKPLLYLAFEFAIARKIPAAFIKVKQALALQPQSIFGQHLLTLLLTSRGQYAEAKQTLDVALSMYPEDLRLLSTKCKLAQHVGDVNEALRTCDDIIRIWGSQPEISLTDVAADKGLGERLSVANASFGADLDAGSVAATSAIASRIGRTTSLTSSLADLQPKLAARSSLRAEAWLHVADVYLTLDKMDDAEKCIVEAVNINPLSPSVLYMKGRFHQHRNELDEACYMYKSALIIDPSHLEVREHYSLVLCDQNKSNLAKKLSQDVILQDIKAHKTWQTLAEILQREGDVDGAIECSTFALKLEETAPVVPFSTMIPTL